MTYLKWPRIRTLLLHSCRCARRHVYASTVLQCVHVPSSPPSSPGNHQNACWAHQARRAQVCFWVACSKHMLTCLARVCCLFNSWFQRKACNCASRKNDIVNGVKYVLFSAQTWRLFIRFRRSMQHLHTPPLGPQQTKAALCKTFTHEAAAVRQ